VDVPHTRAPEQYEFDDGFIRTGHLLPSVDSTYPRIRPRTCQSVDKRDPCTMGPAMDRRPTVWPSLDLDTSTRNGEPDDKFRPANLDRTAIHYVGDIFIPRILQREWRGLSRHLIELTPFQDQPQAHLLPVTVLFLPKFVPSLSLSSPHRVDGSAVPKNARWHRQQADVLRGMQGEPDS
jgi:hypothetical protein